ncbi:hypothetical protein CHLNCDRAFT_59491 [Chlorella variabilis]|uniref:SUEL-type lectin domain-containing protein n=1 Tax=Chlorella variabilis TaxID=554065 RepID=E1ZUD1_CHLVA|nr:hypothetical protein CHLNCDRAFT_59491 [Chlorella variabilis]EFN50564.1 hypothetical protein CHLNCDRAFT_59491 [Chlorella variabilis]|eukprot:XP_005842696.1 hypothetical protein CHLNCDRAFT_59491 [Chlorella variabilis]
MSAYRRGALLAHACCSQACRHARTACACRRALAGHAWRCIGSVSAKASAPVPVNNEVFYNPCPGVLKKLTFSWECDYPGFAAAPTGGQVARASCGSCLRVGNIIKPVYGKLDHNPSCNSSQSYSAINTVCDTAGRSKGTCDVSNSPSTFGGDPCNNVAKYVHYNYACVFPPVSSERAAEVLENQNLSLQCGCQRVREIWEARWQKNGAGKDGCGVRDVNSVFTSLCLDRYGTACTLNATNANLGGDPCVGEQKKLSVKYRCI